MTAAPDAWLFTRGRQSVRIARLEHPDGRIELTIQGPSGEGRSQMFATVPECMRHQAEIERTLMAEGFTLRDPSDRRRAPDRRRITRSDRRQSR